MMLSLPTVSSNDPHASRAIRAWHSVARPWLGLVLLILFVVVLVRTAWIADDAYITLRVVDNMIHGHGPNWNVSERVQVYTHPLWFLTLSLATLITREFYLTTLILSMILAVAAVAIVLVCLARSWWATLLGGFTLILSPAFVDYSTSGLENPLSFFLLALFLCLALRGTPSPQRSLRLSLLAGLVCVNRLDLVVLVAPAVVQDAVTSRNLRRSACGFLPLIAWCTFALIYYGWIPPNTAYAKLSSGLERSWYVSQGLHYLADAGLREGLLAASIVGGLVVAFRPHGRRVSLGIGIVLYLLYIVWIGGDFMRGRMLTVPLFVSVAILVDWGFAQHWPLRLPILAALLALAFMAPTVTLFSGPNFGSHVDANAADNTRGIADERAQYFPHMGLLNGKPLEDKVGHDTQALLDYRRHEVVDIKFIRTAGVGGFVSGPHPYIIDEWALANPLMARLPTPEHNRRRIGHIQRVIPAGYYLSLLHDDNRIRDAGLSQYYEHIRRITRGPIFSWPRWQSIAGMLLGRYDHLIPQTITAVDDRECAQFVEDNLLAGGPNILWRAARTYCLAGDVQGATPILRRLGDLEIAYADEYIREALGIALRSLQRDAVFSERLLRLLVEIEPQHAEASYVLGAFLLQTGRPAESRQWLQRAVELGSDQARRTLKNLVDAH